VPPQENWDSLAIWRLIELTRKLREVSADHPSLVLWEDRLRDLEEDADPIDRILAAVESRFNDAEGWGFVDENQLELFDDVEEGGDQRIHQVRLVDGAVFRGTWHEIVCHLRDYEGFSHETLVRFMRRLAERWHEQAGVEIPFLDPKSFLLAAIGANLMRLDEGAEDA
jgi:hypothetical protein